MNIYSCIPGDCVVLYKWLVGEFWSSRNFLFGRQILPLWDMSFHRERKGQRIFTGDILRPHGLFPVPTDFAGHLQPSANGTVGANHGKPWDAKLWGLRPRSQTGKAPHSGQRCFVRNAEMTARPLILANHGKPWDAKLWELNVY